jgi:hypothetical protein
MTKEEEDFVKEQGPLWHKAMIAATLHIRSDRRFVGLDKVREPAILEATFKAFGREMPNRTLANMAIKEGASGVLTEIDQLIAEAAKVAKKAINEAKLAKLRPRPGA